MSDTIRPVFSLFHKFSPRISPFSPLILAALHRARKVRRSCSNRQNKLPLELGLEGEPEYRRPKAAPIKPRVRTFARGLFWRRGCVRGASRRRTGGRGGAAAEPCRRGRRSGCCCAGGGAVSRLSGRPRARACPQARPRLSRSRRRWRRRSRGRACGNTVPARAGSVRPRPDPATLCSRRAAIGSGTGKTARAGRPPSRQRGCLPRAVPALS